MVRWIYTFFFIMLGWVLFNLTDFAQLRHALYMMFTPHATDWVGVFSVHSSLILPMLYLPVGILFSFPILRKCKAKDSAFTALVRTGIYAALFLGCAVYIVSSGYNPFIYFRF